MAMSNMAWILAFNAIAGALVLSRLGGYEAISSSISSLLPKRAHVIASCGLVPYTTYAIVSSRVVLPGGVRPAVIVVSDGRIQSVHEGQELPAGFTEEGRVLRFQDAVVAPGVIDVHVHLNEPGRKSWEGVSTGTAAAARGGVTTVVDMPLNSNPVIVTPQLLLKKIAVGRLKAHVNVAYWAGITPVNAHAPAVLDALLDAGAVGFKSFMSPSGIDDFANVSRADVAAAIAFAKSRGVAYYVHAELVTDVAPQEGSSRAYATYLATRPPVFEQDAIQLLAEVLDADTSPAAPGFALHVAHLSDSGCLQTLAELKQRHSVSVETCAHYLMFADTDIPDGNTLFKCAPPLRDAANRAALRTAAAAGQAGQSLDLIASDHSPAPPHLKQLESGDFLKAWGGISGLQYLLPATWTALRSEPGFDLLRLSHLLSAAPAKLAGLQDRKGALAAGMDADIMVWEPEVAANTSVAGNLHKHKLSPYTDVPLLGAVLATIVRGQVVHLRGQSAPRPCGGVVLRASTQ